MSRARSVIAFLDRYLVLAGRSCCAGRSWTGLDRSLARRAADVPAPSCEPPSEPSHSAVPDPSVRLETGASADRSSGGAMSAPGAPARR